MKPLLTEHFTQLFNDGHEKSAISFTDKNTNQPSSEWSGDRLDQKIRNGEEVYVVFDKSRIKANSSYVRSKADSVTQLGYMDWPEIIVLAMEAKPQVQVFQSKKNALKFLRENDSNLFTKELTEDKSELLEQMGVDSSKHEAAELKRMLEYADIAKQTKDKLPTGEGEIKKLFFFSPPHFQDKDCAVVVSQKERPEFDFNFFPLPLLMVPPSEDLSEYSPKIWLLVYETPWKNIGNNLYVKKEVGKPWKVYSSLEGAEKDADRLVKELMDKNNPYPACAVFERVGDVFNIFSFSGDIEGVEGFKLSKNAKNNPEGHFKFGDIARRKIKNRPTHHVAIYLGDGYVAQLYDESLDSQENKKKAKARIDTWEEFLRYNPTGGEIIRHHVFVPYKKEETIKEHIARAISSKEYDSGSYDLLFGAGNYKKGNCQHFTNRCVLSLNISNEGTAKKINEDEPLKNEILATNQHFNSLSKKSDKELKKNQDRIDQYTAQIQYKPIWVWKKPVNLKPNPNCKLQ